VGQPSREQERPVSAPAERPWGCYPEGGLGAPSPISGNPVKWARAERESERPIVPMRPWQQKRECHAAVPCRRARERAVRALLARRAAARGGAGQITVYGKGAKTRAVLLSAATWRELVGRCGDAGDEALVFRSRKGGPLDPAQVWRIVRAAAQRAGIAAGVSPHGLRHAHASHALDRGAPGPARAMRAGRSRFRISRWSACESCSAQGTVVLLGNASRDDRAARAPGESAARSRQGCSIPWAP
jgi:Phage integrase family